MAMSCELNLNQREKKDSDTASWQRSRAPDGHAPVVIYRRARPATATIRGRFRLFLLGWLDKMIRAVRMGRDLRSTALGQRPCQYVACRQSSYIGSQRAKWLKDPLPRTRNWLKQPSTSVPLAFICATPRSGSRCSCSTLTRGGLAP